MANPIRKTEGFLAGSETNDLNESALIEARSTEKGILIPKVTTTQMDAITVGADQNGLLVFNVTVNSVMFYDHASTSWKAVGGGAEGIDETLAAGNTTDNTATFENENGDLVVGGGSIYQYAAAPNTDGIYLGFEGVSGSSSIVYADNGGQTYLDFEQQTGTGRAIFRSFSGTKHVQYEEDLPSATGVQSVTGATVNNADPQNPIVNTPTFQQVTDAGSSTTNAISVTNGTGSGNVMADNIYVTNTSTGQYANLLATGLQLSTNTTSKGLLVKNDNMTVSYTVQAPNLSPTGTFYWPLASAPLSLSEVDALSGVSSNIQTQLNGKEPIQSGTGIILSTAGTKSYLASTGTGDVARAVNPIFTSPTMNTQTAGTNNLTGATTAFVQTALANRPRTIVYDDQIRTHTGTTNSTLVFSQAIPANTLIDGLINFQMPISRVGTSQTITWRIYLNDTNDLTTPILIGVYSHLASNLWGGVFTRTYTFNSNTITGFPLATSAINDFSPSIGAPGSEAITASSLYYFIVAAQLGNSADTAVMRGATLSQSR